MATRFAAIQPEQLATIQTDLERGRLVDWADLVDRMIQRDADILAVYESRLSVISGAELVVEPGIPTGDPTRDAQAASAASPVAASRRS
jgi:phage gp29-like protein